MKVTFVTLFPEMFKSYFAESMMWKAQKDQLLELDYVNIRDFGIGPRKQVDDTPYGGGDGMVLKPEPVVAAIESARDNDSKVFLMSPQGEMFTQGTAESLRQEKHIILVCGRYEGFDERIRAYVDGELSIGQYVLTGGELPAMVIVDAITRLIPGVLGGDTSAEVESFSDGKTLEYPQYTKPEEFRTERVPEILLSGHHARIAEWRTEMAQKKTNKRSEKS